MKDVIATWSGGKDSCLATYKAMQQGYRVTALANTISHDFRRVRFHGVPAELIQTQAEAIGLPLLQAETTPDNYEREFTENLNRGITDKTVGVVFGDIHLADCLAWAKKVTADVGVKAVEPLWQMKQTDILNEFITAGFEAVVVSTQSDKLGKEWVGRTIDESFIHDIAKLEGIDACGENGEFHSFVFDGPMFQKRISLTKTEKVERSGYWFLDIQKYHLTEK